MMYDDVPQKFVEQLAFYLNRRGIGDVFTLDGTGKYFWIGKTQRENPQTIVEGRYYPDQDTSLIRPYDPGVYFHEGCHRHFAKRLQAGFGKLNPAGGLDEGLAFALQTAVFGDAPAARRYLADSKVYNPQDSSAYSRLLNLYYVGGNYFLKEALSESGSFWKAMFGGQKELLGNWELALQNPNTLLNIMDSTGIRTIEEYFTRLFDLTPGAAEAIIKEGEYKDLRESALDLSPSKTQRINAFHRLASGLFFVGGFGITNSRKYAEELVTSNLYDVAVRGMSDYESVLSIAYELAGTELAESIAAIVMTQPVVATQFKEAAEKLLAVAGTSRKSTRAFAEKFAADKNFRAFLKDKGGANIIADYARETGEPFAAQYLHYLSELDFGFGMRPDYNSYTTSFAKQLRVISGNVSSEDQNAVLELLPKACAASTLSVLFDGVRDFEEGTLWRGYIETLAREMPDIMFPQSATTSFTNAIFSDGLIFGYESPPFIQMYRAAKETERAGGHRWQETMQKYVDKLYETTKAFAAERSHS